MRVGGLEEGNTRVLKGLDIASAGHATARHLAAPTGLPLVLSHQGLVGLLVYRNPPGELEALMNINRHGIRHRLSHHLLSRAAVTLLNADWVSVFTSCMLPTNGGRPP